MKGINTVMEKIDIHIHTRLPKYSGEGRFKSTGSTGTMDYLNKAANCAWNYHEYG